MRRWLQLVEKLESQLTDWQQADWARSHEPPSERKLMGWAVLILLGVPAMAFGVVWVERHGELGTAVLHTVMSVFFTFTFLVNGIASGGSCLRRPAIRMRPITQLYLTGIPTLGIIPTASVSAVAAGIGWLVPAYGLWELAVAALLVGKRTLLQRRSEGQLDRE